jgi:hypothetical protein
MDPKYAARIANLFLQYSSRSTNYNLVGLCNVFVKRELRKRADLSTGGQKCRDENISKYKLLAVKTEKIILFTYKCLLIG